MASARDKSWVCLFTQPRNEKLAVSASEEAGFEAYLPQYKSLVSHARRRKIEIRPLFARYIFVRSLSNQDVIRAAYRLRGVSGFAGQTLENSFVAEEILEEIRKRQTCEGLIAMDFSKVNSGRSVKLIGGGMAGYQAIFQEPNDQKRSWILIEFLGRMHRMKIENRFLELVA